MNSITKWIARLGIYGLFVVLAMVTVLTGQGGRAMTMNYVFLAIMLVIVLVFNFLGIRRLQSVSDDLENAEGTLRKIIGTVDSPSKTEVKFQDRSVLKSDWERFERDWDDNPGMDCALEEYINDHELLEITHAGLCSLVPGFLTSLGILGTFVGLVTGLGGIDFADYDVMRQSVEGLVGGLYVAFYTSIYGISLSIVYNFSYRYFSSGLSVHLERFYDAFHEKVQAKLQKSTIDDITENQREELTKLNLSNAYLKKVEGYLDKGLGEKLGEQISDNLTPVFTEINDSLNKVMEEFRKEQQHALGTIVEDFVSQMQGLLQEPIQEMSRSMSEHVENLGGSVSKLSESQGEMTKKLGKLITQIEETSANTKEVNESSAQIIGQLNTYVDKLNSSSEASEKMINNMNTQTTALMDKLDTYSKNMNDVAQEQKSVLTDLRNHEETLNSTFTKLEDNQKNLSNNIAAFSDSAEQLAKRQADPINLNGVEGILKTYIERFTLDRRDERRQLDESLKQMVDSMNQAQKAYAEQIALLQQTFETIKKDQESIEKSVGKTASAIRSIKKKYLGQGLPSGESDDDKADSEDTSGMTLLLDQQKKIADNLERCIKCLDEEQKRRNRSLSERVSEWFRGRK